jgi:hypothetical protein
MTLPPKLCTGCIELQKAPFFRGVCNPWQAQFSSGVWVETRPHRLSKPSRPARTLRRVSLNHDASLCVTWSGRQRIISLVLSSSHHTHPSRSRSSAPAASFLLRSSALAVSSSLGTYLPAHLLACACLRLPHHLCLAAAAASHGDHIGSRQSMYYSLTFCTFLSHSQSFIHRWPPATAEWVLPGRPQQWLELPSGPPLMQRRMGLTRPTTAAHEGLDFVPCRASVFCSHYTLRALNRRLTDFSPLQNNGYIRRYASLGTNARSNLLPCPAHSPTLSSSAAPALLCRCSRVALMVDSPRASHSSSSR